KYYELNRFIIDYDRLSNKLKKDREQIELLNDGLTRQRELLTQNEQNRQKLKFKIDDLNTQIEKQNTKCYDLEYSIKTLDGKTSVNNEKTNQLRNDNIRLE